MFRDKVQEKASTLIGIGAYSVGGASNVVPGWKTWRSQFADGAQVVTWAVNDDESIWEKTYGTLTYGPPDTISRNYLLSSTGSLISWTATDVVYLYSAPISEALEGRYDGTNGFFVPAGRKPYTAVGAANKTVSANAWADAGGRFSLDNSAADRSVILPPIANVGHGSNVEVFGLSQANFINIVPNGSEIVDYGTGGQTLPLPGKVPILIWKDGTIWRTNFNYALRHCMKCTAFSAASNVDFTSLPYWARHLWLRYSLYAGTAGAQLAFRVSRSAAFDTGNNYAHQFLGQSADTGILTVMAAGTQPLAYLSHTGLSNSEWLRGHSEFHSYNDASLTGNLRVISEVHGINNTGNNFITRTQNWMTGGIDGIRSLMSSGTMTGTIWLDASA